ncbi:MAG: hypothetical protein JW874_00935, partial [Spirochaetales bacterium]|nr:hypothetical protein [Spirochaetales bacterium]
LFLLFLCRLVSRGVFAISGNGQEQLSADLGHTNSFFQKRAIQALKKKGGPESRGLLFSLFTRINSLSFGIKQAAVMALIALDAQEELFTLVMERDYRTRLGDDIKLAIIRYFESVNSAKLPELYLRVIKSDDVKSREHVERRMGQSGNSEYCTALLKRALTEFDPGIPDALAALEGREWHTILQGNEQDLVRVAETGVAEYLKVVIEAAVLHKPVDRLKDELIIAIEKSGLTPGHEYAKTLLAFSEEDVNRILASENPYLYSALLKGMQKKTLSGELRKVIGEKVLASISGGPVMKEARELCKLLTGKAEVVPIWLDGLLQACCTHAYQGSLKQCGRCQANISTFSDMRMRHVRLSNPWSDDSDLGYIVDFGCPACGKTAYESLPLKWSGGFADEELAKAVPVVGIADFRKWLDLCRDIKADENWFIPAYSAQLLKGKRRKQETSD